MKLHLFDLHIDFFLPLWRRVAVVLVCLGWAVVEFMNTAPLWGIVFGGLGLYALWQFFLCGWPDNQKRARQNPDGDVE